MTKQKCFICKIKLNGTGFYDFNYLGERVYLCGHHAQKVMKHIKEMEK